MKMEFAKALNMLRADKRVRRKVWGNSRFLMLIAESSDFSAMIVEVPVGGSPAPWAVRHEDLLADDWEIA
jgi:hypothetical protein